MNEQDKLVATEWLPLADLVVDPFYQRPQLPNHIAGMSMMWDWKACGFLSVSLRDPKLLGEKSYYAVIDGQQRLSALRMRGESQAPCHVYMDLTIEEEAKLFQLLNNSRKPTKEDLFRARLAAGDKAALTIRAAVEIAGWQLDLESQESVAANSESWCARSVASVTALQGLYSVGGAELITATMTTLHTWYGQRMAASADLVKGTGWLLRMTKNEIDQSLLKTSMISTSPSAVLGDAAVMFRFGKDIDEVKPRYKRVAEVLIQRYNKVASSTRRLKVNI